MPSSAEAAPPRLNEDAVRQFGPYAEEIIKNLNQGTPSPALLDDIARRAAVTPGQVSLCIRELAAASQRTQNQP